MYIIQVRSQHTNKLLAVRTIAQPATSVFRQQTAYDASKSFNDDTYVVEYEVDASGKRELLNKYEFCY